MIELLAERGIRVDRSPVCDWVQQFPPSIRRRPAPDGTRRAGARASMRPTSVPRLSVRGMGSSANPGQSYDALGVVLGDHGIPRPARLVRSWNDLIVVLQAV